MRHDTARGGAHKVCQMCGGKCRLVWEFPGDGTAVWMCNDCTWPTHEKPTKGRQERSMGTKLHYTTRDGKDVFNISTTASDADEFNFEFSSALAKAVVQEKFAGSTAAIMGKLLPQYFDIIADMKGYKVKVQRATMRIAGPPGFPGDGSVFAEAAALCQPLTAEEGGNGNPTTTPGAPAQPPVKAG